MRARLRVPSTNWESWVNFDQQFKGIERCRTVAITESPTPPPSAAAFPSLQMAAIPLDQYNGYSASAKGKETSRSLARSTYTTSPSLSTLSRHTDAPSSSPYQSAGIPSSSSSSFRKPRPQPVSTPTRNTSDAVVVGQADSIEGAGRPIGRVKSEVDIRSRSRRLADPSPSSWTSSTPSTSPAIASRSRLPPSPSTPGFSPMKSEYAGSPASFVTARSIPVKTPPPRPTRSPHRDPAPLTTTPAEMPRAKTALIHGTEFEIISPNPPPSISSPSSPPDLSSKSNMSAFIFPHSRQSQFSPTSPPKSRQRPTQHESSGSIFRLDRPHALPESYLAVRESLTQTQIDQFTLSLASQFPSSWTTNETGSLSSSSVASSPTKSRSGGAKGGEGETDDWARQRRMSGLISGLGMILGSTSFGAGALLMEEEEEEGDKDQAGRRSFEQEEAVTLAPLPERFSFESSSRLEPPTINTSRRPSVISAYESAEEGESIWATPRSRHASQTQSIHSPLSFHLDFDPVTFSPLACDSEPLHPRPSVDSSRSITSQGGKMDVAVAFGYACGESEEAGVQQETSPDVGQEDQADLPPTSIRQLVRQSWRLSSSGAGSREFKPISPKRRATRPTSARYDDGLGINLELLDFENPRPLQSSYTPSSRPVHNRSPSIDLFAQITEAPVVSRPPDLPTSPPLVAEPATPVLTMTPAQPTSPAPSSPYPDSINKRRSAVISPRPSPIESHSMPSPQPRTSSLAPSSSLSSSNLRRRSSHEDGLVVRRRSVLGASKSSKRISALFSSGIDKVRARTSSHNSKDADDEREKDDGRTVRRRALTDGLISGPISSPSLSASTSASPLPPYASSSSNHGELAPPVPSTPLTQSPFQGRTWRSTISQEQFEDLAHNLGAMEMRRQEVIWELCETERSFVNGLRGVIQVFTLPLRTRNGTWIKGVPVPVSRLLDWLDDIVHLHSQIYDALEEARSAQLPLVAKIADAFLPFVARLEVHQPYLVRFEAVTRQIDEMTTDPASDFGEFVRMQSSLPECGSLSLSSFLLKPVQRLMKYPLFFRQLCDLTPPTHLDHFSTLSLLHSTDSIIRVMQEVKTREDEYEETKLLESRISGLPSGFQLACRDRRLVAHGVLKRVHISDKDRSLLEMDAIARAGMNRPNLRGNAPISPGLSPIIDSARPQSAISDSSSSSLSAGSMTYASDPSSGWNSPTTPGAFQSPARFDFGHSSTSPLPSPLLRPDSMASNSSSIYSEDSQKYTPSAFNANSANRRPARRIVKTKAKETSVYVFVFSDLVVLATKASSPPGFIKTRGSTRRTMQEPSYRALETVGLSRVLGVSDLSGKTEHEHLVEVDLLPIREGQEQTPLLSLSNTSLASSIYFTLPPTTSSRSPLPPSASFDSQVKERIRWLQAFERSYLFALRSLSFPSVLSSFGGQPPSPQIDRLSCASYLDAGIVPKSPSQQYLEKISRGENSETTEDGSELEREERGWWAIRLKKVRKEMEGSIGGGEGRNEGSNHRERERGGGQTWQPSSSSSSSFSKEGRRRMGSTRSYGVGQILPRQLE